MGLKKLNSTSLERLWNRDVFVISKSIFMPITLPTKKHEWLWYFLMTGWNRSMRNQKRKVLLMDNAPSHSVPNLSNVEIHFLPPTTTSHLQPLDAGIIRCFKGHYRRQHLRHLVDCIDNDALVSLKDTIRYIKCAWNEVSSSTIINCWVHSGLVERNRDTPQVEPPRTPQMKMNCCCHVCTVTLM